MASNDDIMRVLGQLESKLDAVVDRLERSDDAFAAEQRSAQSSRARIHARLDEQGKRITEAEKTIVAAGATVAQQRDVIKVLTDTVAGDIKPTIDEWKKIKLVGGMVSGALIAVGISAATVAAWAWDWLWGVLSHIKT
ncbi:hypothetical protein HJB56_05195 [Rhizobium lentis]|uniref:hypothetical protein n=2 Tax=Rhizobium lentis TaxID=1138194 RepID=UPI001C840899|nr:hypothetical protein [Rhizobium lentis]MBX5082181.1 hypothetical protein [Rhizobium lentis]MBX5094891.1 hypothetical protein [Rhizobium lentis]MBX5119616.1 hypothetical protein [Rhizobium lentis]